MKNPKFKEGDVVWGAKNYKKAFEVQCPDCLGKRIWSVTTPSGQSFTVPCNTCQRGFEQTGTITEWRENPSVEKLTIGSVRIDTNDKEHPISYMCRETGVGCGTVHYEERLFSDKVDALDYATDKARELVKKAEEEERKSRERKRKNTRKNPTRK